ncbi:S8 family peptidase [soil metagenome]
MKKNYKMPTLNKLIFGMAMVLSVFTINSCNQDITEDVTPQAQSVTTDETSFQGKNGDIIPGKYIVVLKKEEANLRINPFASYEEVTRQARNYGLQVLSDNGFRNVAIEHAYGSTITGFSAAMSERDVLKLQLDQRVAYVEPDRVITLSQGKRPGGGGGGGSTGEDTPWGIKRVGGGQNGTSKTAWVIDTGIDLTHPDLNINKDDTRHWSAFSTGRDKSPNDGNGHGTHVAGTIAAIKGNGIGVVGVAPGAPLVAVKVLSSSGSGSTSGVIAGINYVGGAAKTGEVANMSLGGSYSETLNLAVTNAAGKGIFFAIAAGNDSKDASKYSPASAEGANIFTVSAMGVDDLWASFSNFGNPPIDYCAPGRNIKSTWKDGGYNTISGTSMAAPHVAGILLLTNGSPETSGSVNNDPDGNPDPIAHVTGN